MEIYLDHNATSPLAPGVEAAMAPFARDRFANPSSLHPPGRDARRALEEARERFASAVGARADGVIFTSGATEAITQALVGVALACGRGHLVVSAVEHAAVRETVRWLATLGFAATWVRPDRTGLLSPDDLAAACRADTFLVAAQLANNEVGTIQPAADIVEVAHRHGALCLVDAVQGLGRLPLDLSRLRADLVAFSAHKAGGPKGVGALVVAREVEVPPLLHGGGQEGGRRSGTENVPGAVGFAVAAERAVASQPASDRRWRALRPELLTLTEVLPDTWLNGHPDQTLQNTLSLCFRGVDGTRLTELLGRAGIAVSPGSACECGHDEPSAVLLAMGLDEASARGTVRFSMGPDTSPLDLARTREAVVRLVCDLRANGGGAGCATV